MAVQPPPQGPTKRNDDGFIWQPWISVQSVAERPTLSTPMLHLHFPDARPEQCSGQMGSGGLFFLFLISLAHNNAGSMMSQSLYGTVEPGFQGYFGARAISALYSQDHKGTQEPGLQG